MLEVDARKRLKEAKQQQKEIEQKLEEMKILEQLPDDEQCGNRRHAWVVILSNVNCAAKKCADSDHEFDSDDMIRPFFIEPSTGAHFQANDSNYFAIDSVWNESNYYASLHNYQNCFSF